MKIHCILFAVAFLTTQSNSSKSPQCTNQDVTLSNGLQLTDGTLKLPEKFQDIQVKMNLAKACSITVSAYKEMQMNLTVLQYLLKDDINCKDDFFKAGTTESTTELEVCQKLTELKSIKSTNKKLYLEIKSTVEGAYVVLNFASIQGDECGQSEITLTMANETILFPRKPSPFTANSECDITVKGIRNRAFELFIPDITLSDSQCNENYLIVSTVEIIYENDHKKICKNSDVSGPISAPNGVLHLRIVTLKPKESSSISLRFETNYPECGASEVTIPNDGMEIKLPPNGEKFKPTTLCIIKFSGTAGMDFNLTIPEIKFPTGSCNNDYVSASGNQLALPNINYQHCGTTPVTDPFKSTGGTMFLQIKTTSNMADIMVKLKFQKVVGAGRTVQYSLATVILVNLHSLMLR